MDKILDVLINLCDDLAWGRVADESGLFELTKSGSNPSQVTKLAEAFGLMVVKVEARDYHKNELIEHLTKQNLELEEARNSLTDKNVRLVNSLQEEYTKKRIIGQCDQMDKVVKLALSIAKRPINTLILGATGSGKEVIAKTIHYNSPRSSAPFIAVNCTAIPETLFESEMFGIEKGVATGVTARKGLIEEASGGTLFLDELADMSLANQAKILRVLEEKELTRVGGTKLIPVDVKIIAATHQNIEDMIKKGTFRQDLYYRINVAEVRLPSLAERGEDILLLANFFLNKHCMSMSRSPMLLSKLALVALLHYSWKGNVRELNNEMERVAALTAENTVELADLSRKIREHYLTFLTENKPSLENNEQQDLLNDFADLQKDLPLNLFELEKITIFKALEEAKNNKSKAAELLGITREGLRKKLIRISSL